MRAWTIPRGALILTLLLVSCGQEAGPSLKPTPPPPSPSAARTPGSGPRVLAISVFPRSDPQAQSEDVVNAFSLAQGAGARGMLLNSTWRALEPAPGKFDLAELASNIKDARARFPAVLLGIQTVNTTAKEAPIDLANAPFDSAKMKARFRALIDALRPHLTQRVAYLSLGNEVDVYLAAHNEWSAYKSFYQDAVGYVHAVAPGVKVGVTATFGGAQERASKVTDLNTASDVVILTYYPLGSRFVPRPPSAAATDIPQMVAMAAGRPVVLQEVGYPTSTQLASSEAAQAEFVRQVFAGWKAVGGSIPFLNFFLLHDYPQRTCDEFSRYYGMPNDGNLKAYLCSLGLRRTNGTPKPGWEVLVKEAAAAGLR